MKAWKGPWKWPNTNLCGAWRTLDGLSDFLCSHGFWATEVGWMNWRSFSSSRSFCKRSFCQFVIFYSWILTSLIPAVTVCWVSAMFLALCYHLSPEWQSSDCLKGAVQSWWWEYTVENNYWGFMLGQDYTKPFNKYPLLISLNLPHNPASMCYYYPP